MDACGWFSYGGIDCIVRCGGGICNCAPIGNCGWAGGGRIPDGGQGTRLQAQAPASNKALVAAFYELSEDLNLASPSTLKELAGSLGDPVEEILGPTATLRQKIRPVALISGIGTFVVPIEIVELPLARPGTLSVLELGPGRARLELELFPVGAAEPDRRSRITNSQEVAAFKIKSDGRHFLILVEWRADKAAGAVGMSLPEYQRACVSAYRNSRGIGGN